MKVNSQKGAGTMEGIIMLVILSIIIFLFILPSRKLGPTPGLSNFGGGVTQTTVQVNNSNPNPNAQIVPITTSVYARELSLSSGNASGVYQPYEEYITLNNYSQNLIDITGWRLQNGRGDRAYDVGGSNLQHFQSVSAYIPKAAGFVSPIGQNLLQDVILKPGDTAIITTGSVGSSYPYQIVSFKENECSGYLGNLSSYTFNPYLDTSCVPPSQEPGLRGLDVSCQNLVSRLGSCQTPKFDTNSSGYATDSQGHTCVGCVNGTPVSNACYAFIKAHFSYEGCLANHASDPNFYGHTWRIFLNQPWEMWAQNHETISLFDLQNRLAAFINY